MTGRTALLVAVVALVAVGVVAGVGSTTADTASGPGADVPSTSGENETLEDAYEEPAPEPGDEYYEAADPDGDWISYINPRDQYRSPYNGDGSGKLCVTLLNEAGEPIVGESVPNTTVTVPTGESVSWHTDADPMQVRYPLTDHYERPLDSDQFGTDPELPQGDGYMDSHCIEIHGISENGTVEYGEVQIDGEYDDRIDVVGYIQREHRAWDTDIDPISAATSYDEAGGGWTYEPGASHGQAVVVLQLDPPEADRPETDQPGTDHRDGATEDPADSNATDGPSSTNETNGSNPDAGSDDTAPTTPGTGGSIVDGPVSSVMSFATLGAIVAAVAVVAIAFTVRGRRNGPS